MVGRVALGLVVALSSACGSAGPPPAATDVAPTSAISPLNAPAPSPTGCSPQVLALSVRGDEAHIVRFDASGRQVGATSPPLRIDGMEFGGATASPDGSAIVARFGATSTIPPPVRPTPGRNETWIYEPAKGAWRQYLLGVPLLVVVGNEVIAQTGIGPVLQRSLLDRWDPRPLQGVTGGLEPLHGGQRSLLILRNLSIASRELVWHDVVTSLTEVVGTASDRPGETAAADESSHTVVFSRPDAGDIRNSEIVVWSSSGKSVRRVLGQVRGVAINAQQIAYVADRDGTFWLGADWLAAPVEIGPTLNSPRVRLVLGPNLTVAALVSGSAVLTKPAAPRGALITSGGQRYDIPALPVAWATTCAGQ